MFASPRTAVSRNTPAPLRASATTVNPSRSVASRERFEDDIWYSAWTSSRGVRDRTTVPSNSSPARTGTATNTRTLARRLGAAMDLPDDASSFGLGGGAWLAKSLYALAGIFDLNGDPVRPFRSAKTFFTESEHF